MENLLRKGVQWKSILGRESRPAVLLPGDDATKKETCVHVLKEGFQNVCIVCAICSDGWGFKPVQFA